MVRECLKAVTVRVEDRCAGHMADQVRYVVVEMDGEVLLKVEIGREIYSNGEWVRA